MCRGQSDLRGGWQGRKENTAHYEKNVHAAPVRRHKSEKKKKSKVRLSRLQTVNQLQYCGRPGGARRRLGSDREDGQS